MRDKAAAILMAGFCLFLSLTVAIAITPSAGASAWPDDAALPPPTSVVDEAPVTSASGLTASPLCAVDEGDNPCTWWQHWEGIWIKPLEQHDENEFYQWVKTWIVSTTLPGWVITATVATYHCPGLQNMPQPLHCGPELSAYTTTHLISITMPISNVATFVVTDTVSCCELDESDLLTVNENEHWSSSYFVRRARAPVCPVPPTTTPTPTVTNSPTPSSTATETHTPTATATGTETATPTVTETANATETATPTDTATATPTEIDTATATETATATPTQTVTGSATATVTVTGSATPTSSATASVTHTGTSTATATQAATPVTCEAVRSGSTTGAPNRFNGYNCFSGDQSGPDHLYVITTTVAGPLSASLSGLSADLDVFILSAPSALSCLAYGDNTALIPNAPAGTYYVVVDGFAGASGAYTLAVGCGGPTATPTETRTPTATYPPRISFPVIMKDYSQVF